MGLNVYEEGMRQSAIKERNVYCLKHLLEGTRPSDCGNGRVLPTARARGALLSSRVSALNTTGLETLPRTINHYHNHNRRQRGPESNKSSHERSPKPIKPFCSSFCSSPYAPPLPCSVSPALLLSVFLHSPLSVPPQGLHVT